MGLDIGLNEYLEWPFDLLVQKNYRMGWDCPAMAPDTNIMPGITGEEEILRFNRVSCLITLSSPSEACLVNDLVTHTTIPSESQASQHLLFTEVQFSSVQWLSRVQFFVTP